MKKSSASDGRPSTELISKRIAELGDWRGDAEGNEVLAVPRPSRHTRRPERLFERKRVGGRSSLLQ